MADHRLSTGQRRLLAAVARLREIDPGPAEPAIRFRPVVEPPRRPAWPGLEAMVSESGAGHGSSRAEPRGPERDADTRRRHDAADDGTLPPPPGGAVELAAAVARGEIDPLDLVDDLRVRIERLDPDLGAIVTPSPDRARRDARRVAELLDGGEDTPPLAGVPVVHKDIVSTREIPTTCGSALLLEHVPRRDAAVAARLREAGSMLLGKAATHEFATGVTGTVSCHGPTRNPWDRDRMAGGSSSGSAAALAAGLVVLATGTDTGGSIRIPASCCGVVGLKPTYGLVDRDGVVPFAWSLDHVGPMARSVADVALMLDVMAGDREATAAPGTDRARCAAGSSTVADVAVHAVRDGDLAGLRFAVIEPFLRTSRPEVAEAVEEAAGILEEQGADRTPLAPLPELDLVAPAAVAVFLAEGGSVHGRALARWPERYQEETRSFLELAPRIDAPSYVQAQRVREMLSRAVAGAMAEIDLLVCPTLPTIAPPLDARTVSLPEGEVDVRAALTRFTRPFNLTGQPAMSLPCGLVDGLPVGLQLVGRPFRDEVVLAVGSAYQGATDWHRRRPPGLGARGTEER